jgi:hypothetical protein
MDEETQETLHSTTEHFTETINNQDVCSANHVHKLHECFFFYVPTDQCRPRLPIFEVSIVLYKHLVGLLGWGISMLQGP